MSHFVTWVLLAGDTLPENVDGAVVEVLAKYYEDLEVDEYDRECWCVGKIAEREACDCASSKCGSIDQIRESHNAREDIATANKRETALRFSGEKLTAAQLEEFKTLDAFTSAEWKKAIGPFVKAEAEALAAHPMKSAASPTCDECNGSGTVKSTRNPLAKWDWWVIGGRWAGVIRDAEESMPDDVNMFEDREGHDRARRIREDVRNNSRHVAELPSPVPDDMIPFAIVTPDGEWHEKGSMGWFGMSSGDRENWRPIARSILAAHPTALAVAVDLHI